MAGERLCMVCGSYTSGSVVLDDEGREWLCFRCYLWGWYIDRVPTFVELGKMFDGCCEGRCV